MAKKIQKANPGTIKKVLSYIGKYKYLLPLSILCALIFTALSLYIPILIGQAIDLIVAPGMVNLDKILVLDDGKCVDIGQHDELISRAPIYREIYESQFKKEAQK